MREAGLSHYGPKKLYPDNQSVIRWASGENYLSKQAKRVSVAVHFIRHLINENQNEVNYVPS